MRRLASRLALLLDAHPPDAVARASCLRVASAASASSSGRPPLDVDRSVVARAGWSFRGPVRGASAAAAAAPSVAAAPSPAGPPAASAFDASSPRMSPSRLRRLRVENLRELAAARGLDVAGRKVDLVSRLLLSFDGDDAEDRRASFGAADPLPAPVPPRSPPSEDEVGALLDRPQGSSSPAGALLAASRARRSASSAPRSTASPPRTYPRSSTPCARSSRPPTADVCSSSAAPCAI